MKSARMNRSLLALAAAALIAAPFLGLAWRTSEWLGW